MAGRSSAEISQLSPVWLQQSPGKACSGSARTCSAVSTFPSLSCLQSVQHCSAWPQTCGSRNIISSNSAFPGSLQAQHHDQPGPVCFPSQLLAGSVRSLQAAATDVHQAAGLWPGHLGARCCCQLCLLLLFTSDLVLLALAAPGLRQQILPDPSPGLPCWWCALAVLSSLALWASVPCVLWPRHRDLPSMVCHRRHCEPAMPFLSTWFETLVAFAGSLISPSVITAPGCCRQQQALNESDL